MAVGIGVVAAPIIMAVVIIVMVAGLAEIALVIVVEVKEEVVVGEL